MLYVRESLKYFATPSYNKIFTAELAQAVRADNHMRFGLYHSLFEWYNPMYVSDRNSDFSQNEFVQKKVKDTLLHGKTTKFNF